MTIQVGIIEDELDIRLSMLRLINDKDGFSCKHTFENAQEALNMIPSLKLDIVLTDIHLPDKSGIECIRLLRPKVPETQFLIVTKLEDTDTVFSALRAGAVGYLTKSIQPEKLLEAITDTYNGGSPMNSLIARKVIAFFHKNQNTSYFEVLTSREQEMVEYLAKGYRYKEIANLLFVSTETVRTHIRNIYKKLEVNSRTDALNKIYRK